MGAGAGCTITLSNTRVNQVSDVSLADAILDVREYGASITLDCNVGIEGTINIASYYDGSGDVAEVSMTVTSVSLDLGIGNGYDEDILTAEAADRFEEQFGGNINDIWEDFLPELTVEDIDPAYIKDQLQKEAFFDGEGRFGGGWVGTTFKGDFEISDVDGHNGYNPVTSFGARVNEDFVIDYLDKAKYGDNVEYTAFYNGDILDTYNSEEEAIDALKQEISANVSAANPYDCYVERTYYYLTNGSVGNYEYESDFDNAELVYNAENDFSDDLYNAIDELDEEAGPEVDEGFDI